MNKKNNQEKNKNKGIIMILVMAIIICTTKNGAFAEDKKKREFVSELQYEVLENENEKVRLLTDQDDFVYETTCWKDSNEVNIVCSEEHFFYNKEVFDYTIEVINFNYEKNILEYNILDNKTGIVTFVSDVDSMQPQLPIAIYGGVPLATLIIDALLATLVVATIAGISYYAVSEVIEEIKKEKKYFYYAALINGQLCIGGAFENSLQAKSYAIANYNNSTLGVFCTGSSSRYNASSVACYASPMARSIHDNAHGGGEGYYAHYHPAKKKTGSSRYHLHVWHL